MRAFIDTVRSKREGFSDAGGGSLSSAIKLRDYLHPKGLPALLGILVGRMIGRSSARTERLWIGVFSWFAVRSKRARDAARENLRICFPDKTTEEINALADLSNREVGRSLVESFKVWFPSKARGLPYPDVEFRGLEHFEAALNENRGIMLLNCHFGSVDVNGTFFGRLDRRGRRLVGVYRKPSNPYVDKVIQHGRATSLEKLIPINDPRSIVAELKAGSIVWISPDLEATGPGSVFVDFFGAPASTTTWPARLAKMGKAAVLPTWHMRRPDGQGYVYEVLPPFEDFPSDDDAKDARQFNAFIENVIRQKPEMYFWCIKRFKHRPDPASGEA